MQIIQNPLGPARLVTIPTTTLPANSPLNVEARDVWVNQVARPGYSSVQFKELVVPHPIHIGLPAAAPRAEPVDFLQKGFVVTGGVAKVTEAHQNNLRYHLHLAHAQGKLHLPTSNSPVQEVFGKLLDAIGIPQDQMQIYVINDDEPNAYWMRGTNAIFVTRGLLQKPDLTKGELARVLGHELAHYLLYKPNQTIPVRFKNPLFRDLFRQTLAAQRQSEEYGADAIGLIIADAAGYSVDEGLEMDRWLAGVVHPGKSTGSHGSQSSRVLTPGESHPHSGYRVKETEKVLSDPCFVWTARSCPSDPCGYDEASFIEPRWVIDILSENLDALDPRILETIAANPSFEFEEYLTEERIVFELACFLREKK